MFAIEYSNYILKINTGAGEVYEPGNRINYKRL